MLILTRRLGETLVVGDDGEIRLTVLGVSGNQVRLGIVAPLETSVHREEIFDRIQREKNGNCIAPDKSGNSGAIQHQPKVSVKRTRSYSV